MRNSEIRTRKSLNLFVEEITRNTCVASAASSDILCSGAPPPLLLIPARGGKVVRVGVGAGLLQGYVRCVRVCARASARLARDLGRFLLGVSRVAAAATALVGVRARAVALEGGDAGVGGGAGANQARHAGGGHYGRGGGRVD